MKPHNLRRVLTLRAETIRQLTRATDRELRQVHGGGSGSGNETACSDGCSDVMCEIAAAMTGGHK